jgi:carbon-monoxide dehydrogenase medium subunit
MSLPRFEYRAPVTIDEAVALRRQLGQDALVMAGGIAVMILLRERLVRPAVIISLSEIPALRSIDVNGGLRLGATATHSAVACSEAVRRIAPLLAEACAHVGSPAIRNMGTLGGSVCHGDSASDPAPALLALDAFAILARPGGERRVPLNDFFLGPLTTAVQEDELLTGIYVPEPQSETRTRFIKYIATSAEAFSTVTVAISIRKGKAGSCEDVRIGLGSVGSTPLRARAAEDALRGRRLSPDAIVDAATAAMGATDPPSGCQGSADYRRAMTGVWTRRLLEDLAAH